MLRLYGARFRRDHRDPVCSCPMRFYPAEIARPLTAPYETPNALWPTSPELPVPLGRGRVLDRRGWLPAARGGGHRRRGHRDWGCRDGVPVRPLAAGNEEVHELRPSALPRA